MRKSWNIYQKEQISKIAQFNQTHVVNVQQKKSQNIKQALERLSRSCLKEINQVWIKIVNKGLRITPKIGHLTKFVIA